MTPLAEYYFELPITGNRDLNFDYFDELFLLNTIMIKI